MRLFTAIEANAIFTTLTARAGANENEREEFVHSIIPPRGVAEYQFQGLLGLGGTFHNNDMPHIDYNPEDRNDERDTIVKDVNLILQTWFHSFTVTEDDIGRYVRRKSTGEVGRIQKDPGNGWIHPNILYEWQAYKNDLEYVDVVPEPSFPRR